MPEPTQLLALEDPSVNEFLAHPDFRQIAAFFLGWVFMNSLGCMIYSSIFQKILQRFIFGLFTTSDNNVPDLEAASEKSSSIWTSNSRGSGLYTKGDNHTLVFTICICLAFASVAYFSSLLSFDPINGSAACAFVVAWGGMAAQSARLIGLLILSFELRQLGISRWESVVFWIWLGVGIVFVFVTNAISTGTTKVVQQLAVALCYRTHFLPTSLVSSFIYLSLELYVVVRLALLIAPTFLRMRHKLAVMTDVRVLRGLSLIFMELLTIVPAVTFTDILGEFVPFSIGSLAVLAAFNYRNPEPADLRVTSIPPSIISSFPSRRSAAPTVHSPILQAVVPAPGPPSPYQPSYQQAIPNHPFATELLADNTSPVKYGQRPKSAVSGLSIDSATANSMRGVVIQVATRGARAPIIRLPPTLIPLSKGTAQASSPKSLDAGEKFSVHPGRSQQILPDQAKYAERFERGSSKKSTPPPIFIDINSPALQSWPSADSIPIRSPTSSSSVVYGSDIIRVARQSSATNATRRTSRSGAATSSLRQSYVTSCDTVSSSPARSSRRYSWAAPNEEMPVPYKAFIEGVSGNDNIASKPRPPTFGEQSFKDALVLEPLSRARTGLSSRPRAQPSGPRIRGPRLPPPPSHFQADRKYLTMGDDRYRRRRSSTLPIESGPPANLNPEKF